MPAGAGGDRALVDDLDESDLSGRRHVGARAELPAVAPDVDDADDLAVFLAEEGEGALRLLVELHLVGHDRALSITRSFTSSSISRSWACGDGLEVREVEAQPVGRLWEPAWRTWVPSTLRSAQWSRWVAEWWR
jgi:hypothetical protein